MSPLKSLKFVLSLVCLSAVSAGSAFATGLSATSVYTSQADATKPGVYDYSLTLNNTGYTTIGTFWFAWVPRGDFLNPVPASINSPAGWTGEVLTTPQGTSLRWTTTSDLLDGGDSLSGFNFTSTETPEQLAGLVPSGIGSGLPITTSFAYIDAPFADPGTQFVATAATPEPSSLIFMATGLFGTGLLVQNKRKKEQGWS